jgi:hypothetical protein
MIIYVFKSVLYVYRPTYISERRILVKNGEV